MRPNYKLQLFALVAAITLIGTLIVFLPPSSQFTSAQRIISAREVYGKLPLSFEAQVDSSRFVARGHGYNVAVTATEVELRLTKPADAIPHVISNREAGRSANIKMRLVNANPAPRIEALQALDGRISYLIGNDAKAWRTGVRAYAKLKHEAIYPGVDLVLYGNGRQMEYDFVIAPGADPRQIKLTFDGAEKIKLDGNGDLLLDTALGQLRQHRPAIYQQVGEERRAIEGQYVIPNPKSQITNSKSEIQNSTIGFKVGAYDPSLPLVIDPVLVYSTFLGSSSENDIGTGIAVDAAGNIYVTGFTDAPDFPTERALRKDFTTSGDCGDGFCPDAFVVKLNPSGSGFIYATYLGGDGSDTASSIAVDAAGNAYVTGTTLSANFPTANPFQQSLRGFDAFVAKLSADGSSLIYSTYFGGSALESGTGIAVDAAGSAYITGTTIGSTDLPTANAFQPAPSGGSCEIGATIPCADAFVAKFNAAGNGLIYSTYLGGGRFEMAAGIAVDAAGQALVTGSTSSNNFPTHNALQSGFAGGTCEIPDICFDAFVTKLSADGKSLVFSTFLGGKSNDEPWDIGMGVATDAAGNSYVTGTTFSRDFPLKNALRVQLGLLDAFVTKFDPAGAVVYSTYLGGDDAENLFNIQYTIFSFIGQKYSSNLIAADTKGNVYVIGSTESADFPTLDPTQPQLGGGNCDGPICSDAFITKLSPTGTLLSSTFLGGNQQEIGLGIAVDAAGNIYATGQTASPNFPLANPKQAAIKGAGDLFIIKIGEESAIASVTSVSAASFLGPQLAPESVVSAFGTGLATQTVVAATLPLPTQLAGTIVTIRDSLGVERLAPLFFVAPTQVNYQITPGTPTGAATITVTSGNGQISRGAAQILSTVPGLFSVNASGQGLAAAVALRIHNGIQTFEPISRFDPLTNQIIAVPIDLGPDSGNATDQVFLILYGTGIRFRLTASATIGGMFSEMLFVGPSTFVGVDQCNIRIPPSLAGRGNADIVLTADGRASNAVRVNIK
jgi:uncharacterized protein (TIGR03437 family)